MRLVSLSLPALRRLRDVRIPFDRGAPRVGDSQLDILVGVNGAGKSTVLEAIGLIFAQLDAGEDVGFPYEIEYELRGNRFRAATEPDGSSVVWRGDGSGAWHRVRSPGDALPARIVAYSAGPGRGLAEALAISTERAIQADVGDDGIAELPEEREELLRVARRSARAAVRALFVSDAHADCVIAALLVHAAASADETLRTRLENLLKRVGLSAPTPARVLSLHLDLAGVGDLSGVAAERLEHLLDQTTRQTRVEPSGADEDSSDERIAVFDLRNGLTRGGLIEQWETPLAFCEELVRWKDRGILKAAHVVLQSRAGDAMLATALSDGELLHLARIGLLLMLGGAEESVILLDEPDTHFNSAWKQHLIRDIRDAALAVDGRPHQFVVATHSELALTDAVAEEVQWFSVEDGEVVIEEPPVSTFAASRLELSQRLFDVLPVGTFSAGEIDDALDDGELTDSERRDRVCELLDVAGPGPYRFLLREELYRLEDAAEDGRGTSDAV